MRRPYALALSFALTVLAPARPLAAQLAVLGAQGLSQALPEVLGASEPDDNLGEALAVGDFNDDGFADLAAGVPGEDIGAAVDSGAVQVFYGSRSGFFDGALDVVDQLWHQDESGVPGLAESGDEFGFALASGDFDGDGFDDLAIGAPGEDIASVDVPGGGAVTVLYGSASGLTSTGAQAFDQANVTYGSELEAAEAGDRFGFALAAGDFDGNGRDELAASAPDDKVGLIPFVGDRAGVVLVFASSASGLTGSVVVLHQGVGSLADEPETDDHFGSAIASGRFDGDGRDDLAISSVGETLPASGGDAGDAGAVHVLYGSASGLDPTSNPDFFHQDVPGIPGSVGTFDKFGCSLAAGDFNGDGVAELVVGAENETVGAVSDVGAVYVLPGTASGTAAAGSEVWHQDVSGVEGAAEAGDEFGRAVAVGDFDDDGFDDLAIGASENVGAIDNAGAVNVLYGTAAGLAATGDQIFDQDHPSGVPGDATERYFFGAAVATGDFDGNGTADLAVGIPGSDELGNDEAGAVDLLWGSRDGALGTVEFTLGSPAVLESFGLLDFRVRREGSLVAPASATVLHLDGTATSGVDFLFSTTSLSWSFADGANKEFPVEILDDTGDEPAETLLLGLTNLIGVSAGSPVTLSITINDNDPAGQIFVDGFESGNLDAWQ